jgi:hypothetical protein
MLLVNLAPCYISMPLIYILHISFNSPDIPTTVAEDKFEKNEVVDCTTVNFVE